MTDEEYKELQEVIQNQLISSSDSLVRCKCGNVMEMVQGAIDMKQKDENGNPFTREAAECMAKYRLRCNECSKNFCT